MTDKRLDQLADMWPIGGVYDAEATTSAARALGELVRYLNHATRTPQALPAPIDVYDVLNALHEALTYMPQLLRQVDTAVARFAADPNLDVDEMGGDGRVPPALVVFQIGNRIDSAAPALQHVAALVASATTGASRLYLRDPEGQQ